MNLHMRMCSALVAGAVVLGAASLSGCSSQIRVNELSNNLEAGTSVDGLPFRSLRRYRLTLYQRGEDGKYVAIQTDTRATSLPDPARLYALRMHGMPLSDDTVSVTLNEDSTIKKVVVDVKGKEKEAADALAKAIGDVDQARSTRDSAAETSTSAGETARLAAQKAKQDAEIAELELAALPSDATAVVRKTAENKVANAKLEANQKARKAGVTLPFPDIGT